jgi:folate-binding Fe-S cluster repair protein YgfZ
VEVQLALGNAGDFWVIGTNLEVPDLEKRRQGRRHLNLTDNSEKPAGQWNKMEIEAKGNELKVWVNGDLVNHGTNLDVTKGAISLQSEGAQIYFRNIYLTPLN